MSRDLKKVMEVSTLEGKRWLRGEGSGRSPVAAMPKLDEPAFQAMKKVRQDGKARLGANQRNEVVSVGYSGGPLSRESLRLFRSGQPGSDSYLDTMVFEASADLVFGSANVEKGRGAFFFNDALHHALGGGDGHLAKKGDTVGKVLKVANSAIRQMQGQVCGDGSEANSFRQCTVEDFGVWVIPCFRAYHATAVCRFSQQGGVLLVHVEAGRG